MNLLESLAQRLLDGAPAIAPPRIPYHHLFPLDTLPAAEGEAASFAPPAPTAGPRLPATRPGAVPPAPRIQRTAREQPATPGDVRPDGLHPPAPRAAPSGSVLPLRAVVHGPAEAAAGGAFPAAPSSSVPAPPPALPTPAPGTPVLLQEDHHVEHHHHHPVAAPRAVQPALPREPARRAGQAAGAPPPGAPRPQPPAPVPPQAVTQATPPARPVQAPAPLPQVLPEASPPVAPVVNVAIGRITVRVQAPPVGGRTETTRPAAPGLGLEAYSAAHRGRGR